MTDAAKAVEAKARVLAVYPDAATAGWLDGTCAIFSDQSAHSSDTGYLGWGKTQFRVNSYQAENGAWIDAASRLTAVEEPVSATDIRRVFPASCEPPVYLDEHLRRVEEPAKPTVELRWNTKDAEGCWCVVSEGKIYGFGPGKEGEKSAHQVLDREGAAVRVYNETPEFTLLAAPGDVREGVELPIDYLRAARLHFKESPSWHPGDEKTETNIVDSFYVTIYAQLLAARQQVAEKDKEIARLKALEPRYLSLSEAVGKPPHSSRAAEHYAADLVKRAEKAEAELSRLRGELKGGQ